MLEKWGFGPQLLQLEWILVPLNRRMNQGSIFRVEGSVFFWLQGLCNPDFGIQVFVPGRAVEALLYLGLLSPHTVRGLLPASPLRGLTSNRCYDDGLL